MRPKTIATFFLFAFVAVSVATLVLNGMRHRGAAPSSSGGGTTLEQTITSAPEPAKETTLAPEQPAVPTPQTTEEVAPTKPEAALATAPESGGKAQAAVESPGTGESGFAAYYFHGAKRCESCNKIEAYSKEALETGFPDIMKTGRVKWKVLNYDEPENTHFKDDFGLFTSSLVLVEMKDGKPARYENLEDVWTLLGDKAKFFQYVQGRARAFLESKS